MKWGEEDRVYVGSCPDLITGIHSAIPVTVLKELCQTIDEGIEQFESQELMLPTPRTRPTMEVV